MTRPPPASESTPEDSTRAPDAPERERREYPHGSGDRNSFSPFGKDRMPRHEGGTQRHAPAAPDDDGGADKSPG